MRGSASLGTGDAVQPAAKVGLQNPVADMGEEAGRQSVVHKSMGWRRNGDMIRRFKCRSSTTPRRHHIPKVKRRTTSWPQYEAGLRQRGDVTFWADEADQKLKMRFAR